MVNMVPSIAADSKTEAARRASVTSGSGAERLSYEQRMSLFEAYFAPSDDDEDLSDDDGEEGESSKPAAAGNKENKQSKPTLSKSEMTSPLYGANATPSGAPAPTTAEASDSDTAKRKALWPNKPTIQTSSSANMPGA